MSWRTVETALDILLGGHSEEVWVGFHGGEPLLRFDLLKRSIEEAERRCPRGRKLRFRLSTNGLLLDKGKATFLAAHEVHTQVSFDGSRTAQDLRAAGTHGLICERLRAIRNSLPDYLARHVKVAVTVTPAAVPTLARSVEDLVVMGVESIDVTAATSGREWAASDECDLERQWKRIYLDALDVYEDTGRVPVTLFRRPPGRVVPSDAGEMCGVARGETLTVDVDGEVFGCTVLARSYQSFTRVGLKRWVAPLRIGPLEAPDLRGRVGAFRSAAARSPLFGQAHRKRSSHGSCRECRFRGECLICPAAIARAGEDPHRVPDFLCAFSRISLSYRERFPPQLLSSPRP
jgi:sulfatase maturation enzyme AslB (radical SAM superfamily)